MSDILSTLVIRYVKVSILSQSCFPVGEGVVPEPADEAQEASAGQDRRT